MEVGTIVVAIGDQPLARVLTLWLAQARPERTITRGSLIESGSAAAFLVTPSDCSPEEAARLTAAGTCVIVLAPVPREEEASRYRRAGAAYVTMTVDNAALLAELDTRDTTHFPIDALATSTQRASPN